MNIIKIRCPEINHPNLFNYTVDKFINGFRYNGVTPIEINSFHDLKHFNSKDNLVFVSNHEILKGRLHNFRTLGDILPECVFICFHFNAHQEVINNMPFKKYILTGEEHLLQRSNNALPLESYKDPRWVPFKFAADLDPNIVGTLPRRDLYKSFFIGPKYGNEYGFPYRSSIPSPSFLHNTFQSSIKEEDRIDIMLSSRTCLGFHSEGNVLNGCITERVFEGLAYGNAVISENPVCGIATDGACKRFSSSSEMVDLIERLWNDDHFFKEVQSEGYNYVLRDGLYYHRAINFLNKIRSLYE